MVEPRPLGKRLEGNHLILTWLSPAVISMIPRVQRNSIRTDHHPKPSMEEATRSGPGTSFRSSRRGVVVVAMAPLALAAFSLDGKHQANQPVSKVG